MNSDFMQMESEALAKSISEQLDNTGRIRKIYNLVYGRGPKDREISLGLNYIRSEPMREYEEQKEKASSGLKSPDPSEPQVDSDASTGPVPSDAETFPNGEDVDPALATGSKMMAGTDTEGAKYSDLKYPVSVWGKYVKTLLGATEFLFIN